MRPNRQQIVLLVEDVAWIRRSMGNTLRALGYRLIEAADAAEALEAARAGRPDVIVTDEVLPTLGQLMSHVRRPGPLHGVPVTIINPDEEEGTRYGDIVMIAGFESIASLLSGALP